MWSRILPQQHPCRRVETARLLIDANIHSHARAGHAHVESSCNRLLSLSSLFDCRPLCECMDMCLENPSLRTRRQCLVFEFIPTPGGESPASRVLQCWSTGMPSRRREIGRAWAICAAPDTSIASQVARLPCSPLDICTHAAVALYFLAARAIATSSSSAVR